MRLFYIIFLLAISANFTVFASHEKIHDVQTKNAKISFVTEKKIIKQQSGFNQDTESLQKDFINITPVKISFSAFVLTTLFLFLLLKNKTDNTKVITKRLKYNYWCLFKMLYPKHVFW